MQDKSEVFGPHTKDVEPVVDKAAQLLQTDFYSRGMWDEHDHMLSISGLLTQRCNDQTPDWLMDAVFALHSSMSELFDEYQDANRHCNVVELDVLWDATYFAALAILAKDILTQDDIDAMTRVWRLWVGPLDGLSPEQELEPERQDLFRMLAVSKPEIPLTQVVRIAEQI